MSDISDSTAKIQNESILQGQPVSESIDQLIGGGLNYLLTKMNTLLTATLLKITHWAPAFSGNTGSINSTGETIVDNTSELACHVALTFSGSINAPGWVGYQILTYQEDPVNPNGPGGAAPSLQSARRVIVWSRQVNGGGSSYAQNAQLILPGRSRLVNYANAAQHTSTIAYVGKYFDFQA